jgi:hypothetical protein
MNSREFIRSVKKYAADDVVAMMLRELTNPRVFPPPEPDGGTYPWISDWISKGELRAHRKADWFATLDSEGKQVLQDLLQECSEACLFQTFAYIDGVGGNYNGVFEITAVAGENRTVLNPENTEMLHDLLSEVCEEDRFH